MKEYHSGEELCERLDELKPAKMKENLTNEKEQAYLSKELAEIFSHQYFNEPLKYQTGLLQLLIMQGHMKKEDANVMALQFFAPIYLLMSVCDREPQREAEALQILEKHIRQFNRMYKE